MTVTERRSPPPSSTAWLTPWADVRLRDAPRAVGRRAGLAAAAVREPELLLLNGLLDGLAPRERASVAAGVRELGRDTIIIAAGHDATTLRLTCAEVLPLSDGILASAEASAPPRAQPSDDRRS